MSRFHRYSVNNTMLIYMQKPDATLVAGYNKWKDQFERHVKKGEHGITIIAPTPYKKKIEEQKLDPDTKAPILDKDGKIVTEEKEIEIPMFRPVKVFDVSQTDGKPLPELASSLSGNVPNYEAFMEALRRSAPVPITFEAMAVDTDGYFSADHQKIAIRQGMSEVQTVSATVHEIAHSKLHNQKKIQIANDEQYQEIELFDKLGLFSNGRIARDNLPEGVYCYDLRGSDYDPGDPVCVEERVVVNHAGSVLLTEPLELTEDGRLMLTEEKGLNFTGGFSTLSQFLQKQRKDRHTEEVEAESISYVDPIIINQDGTIIGGHQRCTVLQDLGETEADVIVLDLSKDDEKALNIALNKIGGEWDMQKLRDALGDLTLSKLDVNTTGYSDDELQVVLGDDLLEKEHEDPTVDRMAFTLSLEQYADLQQALKIIGAKYKPDQMETFGNTNKTGNKIYMVVKEWAAQKKLKFE